jgi:hypothetical protein
MACVIQIRNDSSANWTSVNPVLAIGELAISNDLSNFKIGDGVSAWSALSYVIPTAMSTESVQDIVGALVVDSGSIDFTYDDVANTLTAAVIPSGVNHDNLLNMSANKHVDHTLVSITGTGALTGGGDISSSRTINLTTAGTAGTYGNSSSVPVLTTDTYGRVTSVTPTNISITSGAVNDFTEAVQDVLGALLIDTNTINFTYDDVANTLGVDVKTQMSITSDALWLCTYLLYPSYRIFVPLVYITALFVGIKGSRKIQAPLFFGLILSLFLAFAISRTPWGIGRFNQTSIVAPYASSQNPTTRYIYNESNVFTARIFNNKAVFIFRDFLKEYGEYFSLRFLIGDSGLPFWYAIPQTGTTFLIVCFLLLISIFNRHSYRNKNFALVLGLLFAAAVPAALTNEATPNLHRSLAMSALIPIVAAGAIAQISMCKWAKYYFVIISVCIFIESAFFLHNYFQHINNFSIAYLSG